MYIALLCVHIHRLDTSINVYLHPEIVNLSCRYVSFYANTIKYLPYTHYHSVAKVMTKEVWAKAMITEDDKDDLYFSAPS